MFSIKIWLLRVFNFNLLLKMGLVFLPITAYAECTTSVSTPNMDYGQLNIKTKNSAGANFALGTRIASVIINCDEPEQVTLNFTSSDAEVSAFRFGEHGKLKVTLSSTSKGSQGFTVFEKTDINGKTFNNTVAEVTPTTEIIIPGKGRLFSFDLQITPVIYKGIYSVRDDETVGSTILLQVR
ncbi:hypothetical protein ACMV5I_15255 [Serratia sp. T13T92]|uniref:hypothetical protein n=1 Tax=Serratia sp. T13T92 TaxID=3397496 RepID=UPI0039E0BB01